MDTIESRLAAGDQSLNAPLADGTGERQDLLADDGPSLDDTVIETCDSEVRARWLAAALTELTARERTIIGERRLRDEAVALKALGHQFGISKERVRQIEQVALAKIKRSIVCQSGARTASELFGGRWSALGNANRRACT